MRAGCVSCPVCESILVLSVQESNLYTDKLKKIFMERFNAPSVNDEDDNACTHICMYKCGYCHWNSIQDLGVYSKLNLGSSSDIDEKEIMAKAAKGVQVQLLNLMKRRQDSANPILKKLISSWNEKLKTEEVNKRKAEMLVSGRPAGGGGPKVTCISVANTCSILDNKDMNLKRGSAWSIKSLDDTINKRKNHILKQVNDSVVEDQEDRPNKLSIQKLSGDHDQGSDINNMTFDQYSRQSTISTFNSLDNETIMPIPVKLRTRAVRRDCKELASGKPGILVKPKANPLEGDSSLRYGQGQWWKKDSSAIHTIPKITIYKRLYNRDTSQHALLLCISNPTLGPIRLKVHTNFSSTGDNSFISSLPPTYHNLILTCFPLKLITSKVIPANYCSTAMDMISLDPVEDAFLELGAIGGSGSDVAAEIQNWGGEINWSRREGNEERGEEYCNCKMILRQKDRTYVQFMVDENDLEQTNNNLEYLSTALVLEIQVGDGSWESSLIQKKIEEEDGNEDTVSFIILPTWKVNT